jgi:hypothetical protein
MKNHYNPVKSISFTTIAVRSRHQKYLHTFLFNVQNEKEAEQKLDTFVRENYGTRDEIDHSITSMEKVKPYELAILQKYIDIFINQ